MLVSAPESSSPSPKALIPYQNVHGWERTASIGGGLLLIARGLRRGGLSGLINLGLGGMGIWRGVTGHCEVKRVLERTLTTPTQQTLRSDTRPMPQLHMEAPTPATDQNVDEPPRATDPAA